MNKHQQNLNKDYQDFLKSDQIQIPTQLKESTALKIQRLIKPNAWIVFFKLLGVHSVVGGLSLSICHQFGLNPFNTEKSLADWFMTVGGHNICMLGCGVLFVSISFLAAGFLFSIEEVRALRKHDLLNNLSLGVISLGAFAAFGAELALGIAGLWLLGGFIGGLASMAAVFKLKGASVA